jgi:hypothetical protein
VKETEVEEDKEEEETHCCVCVCVAFPVEEVAGGDKELWDLRAGERAKMLVVK